MNTTIINVKIDATTKKQAQEVAQELGLSLSSLIKAFLKRLIKTKRVTLDAGEEPSEYLKRVIRKAEENYRKGNTSPAFSNAKDAIKYLEDQGI